MKVLSRQAGLAAVEALRGYLSDTRPEAIPSLAHKVAQALQPFLPKYQFLNVDEDGFFYGSNSQEAAEHLDSYEWPGVNVLTGEGLNGCEAIRDGEKQ